MKRILLLHCFLMFGYSYSQTISKQVIGSSGTTYVHENINLSYTAGELFIGSMTDEDTTIQLGNGYYTSLDLSTLDTSDPELMVKVKIFPNPSSEFIYLNHSYQQNFNITLSNIQGKIILSQKIEKLQPLNISQLSNGVYIITVFTKNKQTNTYKIIKK